MQNADLQIKNNVLFHSNILKVLPAANQLQIPTHIFNNLLCTFRPEGRRAIIAPEKLCHILLYLAHNNSGHMSGNFTVDRLSQNWFWPNMSVDADKYCKSCHDCAKIKASHSYTCLCKLCHQLHTNLATDCIVTCSVSLPLVPERFEHLCFNVDSPCSNPPVSKLTIETMIRSNPLLTMMTTIFFPPIAPDAEVGQDENDNVNPSNSPDIQNPPPTPPTPRPPPPASSTGAVPRTRAATKAANVSLPTPSFQPNTLELNYEKKEKEENKLSNDETKQPSSRETSNGKSKTGSLEQAAKPVLVHSLSSQASRSSTRTQSTQSKRIFPPPSSQAALAALEAEKKKEALLHQAVKKATVECIRKQKEDAAKQKK